jgi:very-short-patch-repair endonuclease
VTQASRICIKVVPHARATAGAANTQGEVSERDRDYRAQDHTARLERLVERQKGVVSIADLRACGVGRSVIEYRVRTRRYIPVHRGVYAVGHPTLTWEGRLWAALKGAGPGAALSHRTAAHEWNVRRPVRSVIDVSAPRQRRLDGVEVHRTLLGPEDVVVIDGLPRTTVARTLVDLAGVLDLRQMEKAIREAEFHKVIHMPELDRLLDTGRGRKGTRMLRTALDRVATRPDEPTESALEDRFLDEVVERHGLPRPRCQFVLLGYRLDFFWPDHGLIVEVDGGGHARRSAMQADRTRDNLLMESGYRVRRFTWDDVAGRAEWVADRVRAALRPRAAA